MRCCYEPVLGEFSCTWPFKLIAGMQATLHSVLIGRNLLDILEVL